MSLILRIVHMGQGIQEWTKKSSEKQPLKNLK